jgi:hypothetical protein
VERAIWASMVRGSAISQLDPTALTDGQCTWVFPQPLEIDEDERREEIPRRQCWKEFQTASQVRRVRQANPGHG